MPQIQAPGRSIQDAVNALHNDNTLNDNQKSAVQKCIEAAIVALGGNDRFLDREITASYSVGASFSCSISVA